MRGLRLPAGLLTLVVGLSAALASASPAAALGSCTDSWLGGDGNWFVAGNWSSGAVPGPNDAVCITASGSYTVTVPGGPAGPGAGQAVADTLQLGGASGTEKLVIEADNSCGDSTGAGGLEVYDHGNDAIATRIAASGQVELTQDGSTCSGTANNTSLRVDNGTLSNGGRITTDTGGVSGSVVTARFLQGSITNNAGGTVEIEATTTWSGPMFDNAGAVTFPGESVLFMYGESGSTFINDAGGTITNVQSGGYLFIDSGSDTFQEGAGTVDPFWSRPGINPAVIVHRGALTYTANASSSIEVEGQATLLGDVPSNALLAIECSALEDSVLHASSFTNAGFIGLYGSFNSACGRSRTLSVDSSAGPGTGTLTNNGRIEGYGTIAGNLDNTMGRILPGDSFAPCTPCSGAYAPGVITVTGDYSQGSGGTLGAVNVNNCSPCAGSPGHGYSQLSVQGAASLGGALDMLTGFVTSPVAGDAYLIVTARSVTGTFATLHGQLQPSHGVRYVPGYNPTNVTVDVVKLPKLTVTVTDTGSGAVTSSPAGIDCGTTCAAFFSQAQAVTLIAAPAAGSRFAGWSGRGCRGNGTCTVTMDRDRSLTATFTPTTPPRCTLRLKSRGVKLNAPKRHGSKHLAGTLAAIVACDQSARLKLSGTVTERLGSRRKPRTKRFWLRPVMRAVTPGRATMLVLTLPSATLSALRQGHRETVKLTLRARSASGTTRISTRWLPLIRPPNRHR